MPSARSVFDDPSGPGHRGRHHVGGQNGAGGQRDGANPRRAQRNGAPGYGDAFEDETDGSEEGERHRRDWKQRAILTSLALVIVVCLVGIAGVGYTIHTWGSIERFSDLELDLVAKGDPTNYLIIGSDAREGEDGRRADSIVLFRVEPQAQTAAVVTIPRDMRVPLARDGEFDPSSTPQKINGAYATPNGREDLITTVRENFGVPIHHYIEVDFEGFKRLIDQVGGVEIFIDRAIHDRNTGLLVEQLGCVTLDGDTALQFVRSRAIRTMGEDGEWHLDDGTADLGRGTRQQEFIRQAVGKALKDAPTDPNQMRGVVEILADTVGFDEKISISGAIDMAQQFRDLNAHDADALRTLTLPVIEEEGPPSDPYQLWLEERGAEPIWNVFRGLPEDEVGPGVISLTVLNGTGGEDEATNVAGAFQNAGFKVAEIGDTEERPERTTVYHAPGEQNLGLRVARHVAGGAAVQERADLSSGDVELVTGPGLESVYTDPVPVEEMPDTGPASEGQGTGEETGEPAGGADATPADDGTGGSEASETPPPASEAQSTTTTTVYGTAIGAGSAC